MKKIFFTVMFAVLTFVGNAVKAQDFSSLEGSNYYLIWLDGDTESEYDITDKIVQDLRLNWNYETNPDGESALYIWEGTYTANAAVGKGSFGQIGGFLDFTVANPVWSGLGFIMRSESPTAYPIDYTALTDNDRFHMAFKSPYEKAHRVEVFGNTSGVAGFSVGMGDFDTESPNITPNFKKDQWYVLDIPVSKLQEYGFSNRGTFTGNHFVIKSGVSPNRIAIDAVFFYRPGGTGLSDVKTDNKLRVLVTNQLVEVTNATAPIEVYNLSGIKVKTSKEPVFGVEELGKGAYIIKSGNAVAKVIIK